MPPPDPSPGSPGYTPIPGADALRTGKVGESPAAAAEQLDPAAMAAVQVGEHVLARTIVRDGFIPVLQDVFDRLATEQEPLEQLTYLHLYRLALADERNWCRVSRAELQKRTNLSDRRVMKALAGLVDKGHIALVDRDTRGTLYRVRLPHEVFGEAADAVQQARPKEDAPARKARAKQKPAQKAAPAKAAPAPEPTRQAPSRPSAAKPASRRKAPPRMTVGSVARSFLDRFGERPGRTREELIEQILNRREAGRSLEEIQEELHRFGDAMPETTPLKDLERFLSS